MLSDSIKHVRSLKDIKPVLRPLFKFAVWLNRSRNYNEFGLRFKPAFLERVKHLTPKMPIEVLEQFADGICVQMVMENDQDLIDQVIQMHDQQVYFNHVNTTGIGNIAYIASHHKSAVFATFALRILDRLFQDAKQRK